MKHAALIIAHKNVEQVIRLIRSISSEDLHVFVHLDKKMSISKNDFQRIKDCSQNVFISRERVSGALDTWSLVDIALILINLAKNTEKERKIQYGYYLLLSGQDYPIKSKEYIIDKLNEIYPKPLIDCTPYSKGNWVYSKFNVVQFKSVEHYINSKLGKGILRKFFKLPFFIASKVLSKSKAIQYKYFSSYDYDLYGGSAWWVLPDKVISFILKELKDKPNKIKKLEKTYTPEETFFQIMTMASPLSDKVEVNPVDMVSQNCMTYAHFSGKGKPFVGHPYILTKDDYDMLKEMNHFFARKFDMDVDSEILSALDDDIVRKNSIC